MKRKGTNITRILAVALMCAVLFSACVTRPQKEAARSNLSHLYNPSSTPIHPELMIHHESADRSRLYVKIFPVELLFSQANPQGEFQARVLIEYDLKEIIDGKENEFPSDSASMDFTLLKEESKNVFVANLPIETREGTRYLMEVSITDMLRNKGTTSFIHVDRTNVNTGQNYMVLNAGNGSPSFDHVFQPDQEFYVRYNRRGVDSVYVKFYQDVFPLPRPPLTNLSSPEPEFRADSIFVYPYSDTLPYTLPWKGMYHVQVDPRQEGGLTLFNFGEYYPRVSRVDDMVGPLAYLTSSVEFDELINQTNTKLAVDNFWLQAAGNPQSARELIRVYYNRVYFANYFFTSYKEGWKTDRGMMFIVYGPPNLLTKKGDIETWVYYRKKTTEPLQFIFTRHPSPFTQNDFHLERNYVNALWTQAVRDWRSGKIFYTESN